MPFYNRIDPTTREGERTLERLLALRRQLEEEVPARTLKETLLVATWNIRDFDKSAYGDRLDEAIYYIAEIISHFDLVAIQEVYRDLRGLDRVRAVLGSHWGVNFTDATEGGRGNKERLAFLYDTRKVQFGGLACELVLPPMKDKDGSSVPAEQVWRTPYMCGFKAGWTKFMIATVHILWGASKGEPEDRVSEIRHVAQFLKRRTEDKSAWARNLILLGDFNIFRTDDTTFQELVKAGFQIPEQLQKLPSNAQKVRHYDQIAFRSRKHRLERTGRAGVFDYYQSVFREDDIMTYKEHMMPAFETASSGKPRNDKGKRTYYKTYWRTHQMSDHLPMWLELKIDYTDEYLQRSLASGPKKEPSPSG